MKNRIILDWGGKARRAGIFVENETKNDSSSVGATSSRETEYATPMGLNSGYAVMLQRSRNCGAGAGRAILIALGFILLQSSFCLRAQGQSYSIDWYKIAGGGGTSTGSVYAVSGTIGQHDAGGTMTGNDYSLTGGFWSLISVVQTAGAPTLFITHSGNTVTVHWQAVSGWSLQQNNNLAIPANWSSSSGITTTNGTNYLNAVNPAGNLFFRLTK